MDEALTLEVLDRNIYVGKDLHTPKLSRRAYGGHVVAQAMKAALLSMEKSAETFFVNSIHGYYVDPVRPDRVLYFIDAKRNGRTFCFRAVRAVQGGKTVFKCLVSFKLPDSRDGHLPYNSHPMPAVPGPDDPLSVSFQDLVKAGYKHSGMLHILPFEVKYCMSWKELDHTPQEGREPRTYAWARLTGDWALSGDPNHQSIALSYFTDYGMPLLIEQKYPDFKAGLTTSLDHSVWIHANNIDLSSWHLFDCECLSSGHGQTLNLSRVFTEDGTLVATASQQGLIRSHL